MAISKRRLPALEQEHFTAMHPGCAGDVRFTGLELAAGDTYAYKKISHWHPSGCGV
jgi:hypothetical protein